MGATPLHVLQDETVVNTLRAKASAAAKGGDNTPPPLERLFTCLHQSTDHIKKTAKEKTEKHRKHKQRLTRTIKAADKFLGKGKFLHTHTVVGQGEATLASPPPDTGSQEPHSIQSARPLEGWPHGPRRARTSGHTLPLLPPATPRAPHRQRPAPWSVKAS